MAMPMRPYRLWKNGKIAQKIFIRTALFAPRLVLLMRAAGKSVDEEILSLLDSAAVTFQCVLVKQIK